VVECARSVFPFLNSSSSTVIHRIQRARDGCLETCLAQ
jgi:hypothetical protein